MIYEFETTNIVINMQIVLTIVWVCMTSNNVMLQWNAAVTSLPHGYFHCVGRRKL